MPQRILFIECSPGFGGTCVVLGHLISHLDPERYRACAVVSHPIHREYLAARMPVEHILVDSASTLRWESGVGRVLDRSIGRFGRIGHRAVSALIAGVNFAGPVPRFACRVRRFFSNATFDVVWLDNGVMNNFGAGALLARHWKIPLVCKVEGFTYVSPVSKWLARSVDLFVPISHAVSGRLLRMGVPQHRVVPTYNPVDVVELDPARVVSSGEFRRRDGRSDCLAFGIIGQLLEWKGQHVFLEAAKRVSNRCNDCVAVIVGGEPDRSGERMRYLQDYAAKLGIADRVRFTGHRDDVPKVMAELDIVVHASVKPEPFGMVIVEAMAMKRAVVAARAGGVPEYVEDGVNGLLTTPGDPDELAQAILKLLRDADLRRRLGENGRRTVVERFSADKHAQITQDLLDSLIESHQRRQRRGRCPVAPV